MHHKDDEAHVPVPVLRHGLPFQPRARTVAFLRRTCFGRCDRYPECMPLLTSDRDVFRGWLTRAEEIRSLEDLNNDVPPDPLFHGHSEEGNKEDADDKTKREIEISDEENAKVSDLRKTSLEAEEARLPKPEALQGGSLQALQSLHIGRIPPSCGFCSRERNLCRIISGIFTRSPLPYGYSLVTPIPAGVCNLTITEMKPSKNFFALRRPDGTYVLNGNWDIQAAGQYLIGGTTFVYTPSNEDHGEQLAAPGPLREPIELMLISQSPNPGIKYEYRVPVQEYVSGTQAGLGPQSGGILPNVGGIRGTLGAPPPSFPQGTSGVGSRTSGVGIRNSNTGTGNTGAIPGLNTPSLVPGQLPFGPNNPNIVASNFGPLNPPVASTGGVSRGRGITSTFNPGNVPVQRGSTRPRGSSGISGVIPHLQPITPLGTASQSSNIPLPWNPSYNSPDSSKVSVGSPYLPNPTYPRSPSSGSGFSRQNLSPQHPGDGTRTSISGISNTGIQGIAGVPPEFPRNSVPLRPVAVPIPSNTGSSRTIGLPNHSQHPQSEEAGQNNQPMDTSSTSTHRIRHHHGGKRRQGYRKTSGASSENVQDTPFGIGIQQTQPNVSPSSSFSSSSNETIPSKATRRGSNGGRRRHHQNDSGANRNGNRRKDRTGRRKSRSRYQWAEKGFTPCTKSCGGGNQTTILSCERRRKKTVVPDRRCDGLARPKTHTIMCNLKPCPALWAPGDWGPCSVTCGMGVQTRPLVCKQQISPTFIMMVPEGACLSPPTVSTSQVCEMGRCPSTSPEWNTGLWSNCSAPCGLGSRSRVVQCLLGGEKLSDTTCEVESKPEHEQVCDMGSCALNTWFFSEWSDKCSESCGTGIQTRRVHCLLSGLKANEDCPAESRPVSSRSCIGDKGCGGQWFTGPWEECSTSCGAGRERRSVICVITTRKGKWKVTDDDQCTSEARPYDTQECNVEPCTPQWYTSEWSECSASCEGGVKRREVTCLDALLHPSADCFNTSKPDSREPCHLHPCTTTSVPFHTTTASDSSDENDFRYVDNVGDSKEQAKTHNSHTKTTEDTTEHYEEESEEIENELVVEKVSGNALNVIPDKDAQGDESVVPDENTEDESGRDNDEEAEKKKRERKKNNESESSQDVERTDSKLKEHTTTIPPPPQTEKSSCIDRIKNCHLVFRARLCRLKYYNKLCCRTCSSI